MEIRFASWQKLKNYEDNFCKLKKKDEFDFLWALKSSKDIDLVVCFFFEIKHLKNMDFIFCKLQNPRKDEFNLVFASLKSLRKAILLTIIFTKGNLRKLRGRSMPFFFPYGL